ncbi:MAG: Hsp20/alpha crystallin family protein [Lewinellaceae bacterium]|nr:Hsp20/alpha crystallin family protein [Lewinellaceae bacterium]
MNLINFFPANARRPVAAGSTFDNMFNEFFNNDFPVSFRNGHLQKSPAVNILESDDSYRIEVAAPGLEKGDFVVKVENDLLEISARKEAKQEETGEKFTRREFSYLEFKRNFHLPDTVDANGIKANYENGVLKVVLEKKPEAKPLPARQIEIA